MAVQGVELGIGGGATADPANPAFGTRSRAAAAALILRKRISVAAQSRARAGRRLHSKVAVTVCPARPSSCARGLASKFAGPRHLAGRRLGGGEPGVDPDEKARAAYRDARDSRMMRRARR